MYGVDAEEKLKLLLIRSSGFALAIAAEIMTVLAVPCSPISRTPLGEKEKLSD